MKTKERFEKCRVISSFMGFTFRYSKVNGKYRTELMDGEMSLASHDSNMLGNAPKDNPIRVKKRLWLQVFKLGLTYDEKMFCVVRDKIISLGYDVIIENNEVRILMDGEIFVEYISEKVLTTTDLYDCFYIFAKKFNEN